MAQLLPWRARHSEDVAAPAARPHPLVRDIMSQPPLVVREDSTIAAVAQALLQHGVGAALVTDKQHRLRGMVTEVDFASHEHCLSYAPDHSRRLLRDWTMRADFEAICANAGCRPVSDLMSTYVPTAREDEVATQAVARMLHYDIPYLPVMRAGKPVGTIAHRDVLRLIVCQED